MINKIGMKLKENMTKTTIKRIYIGDFVEVIEDFYDGVKIGDIGFVKAKYKGKSSWWHYRPTKVDVDLGKKGIYRIPIRYLRVTKKLSQYQRILWMKSK